MTKGERTSGRIGPILQMLCAVWEQDPDQRLGQLLCNITRNVEDGSMRDLFNIDDDELLGLLVHELQIWKYNG